MGIKPPNFKAGAQPIALKRFETNQFHFFADV